MKIYEFGEKDKPSIMLFPGTCCHWEANFGHVLEDLQQYFSVFVVSYSGFDETEASTFVSELDEVNQIEAYIRHNLDGKLFAAYGCSLGGSVVSLLVERQHIHITHAILGSSDMDQAPKWLAKLETAIMMPLFYPAITNHSGPLVKRMMKKLTSKETAQAEYIKKFMKMMGMDGSRDFSFLSKESVKNQFCTDLYTKVGDHIQVDGTTIHVFYAKKMGEKYLKRYYKHFAEPIIHEYDLQHEELLLDAKRWISEICKACNIF